MYRNILIAVDADDPAESAGALATAATLADCFAAKLTLCSVVRDANVVAQGRGTPICYEELLFEARSKLDALANAMGKAPAPAIEVATGTICGGVLAVAERISADLIILASHRPGVVDYVRSANAARIARRAACSVLIVRAQSALPRAAARPASGTARPEESIRSRKSPKVRRMRTGKGSAQKTRISEKQP